MPAETYFISMHEVILSLGTNLGDRAAHMRSMEDELGKVLLPPIIKSRLLETEPLGVTADHPWYYNRLIKGGYNGTPFELLAACQGIEYRLGRTRPEKYAPRTADIDIILFGEVLLNDARLVIPHRRLADRRFCLEGLIELAADRQVPGMGKTVRELEREMRAEVRMQERRFIETENHGTT
jgi:2-amino-4-hydroxy-6-hydroxymethyldihydropteridine diphosphokinase